jgi:enoyl-CoA hydratase/carnithine racemase
MTARWVDAAEALRLGLVSSVVAGPLQAAADLAGELARRGPRSVAKAKAITAEGGLLGRLHAERHANESAWAQVLAGPRAAAP